MKEDEELATHNAEVSIKMGSGVGNSSYRGKPVDVSFVIYKTMKEDHNFYHIVKSAVAILKLEDPCERKHNTVKNK